MISDAMLVLCPILNKMMLMMSVKIWLKKKNSLKNISLTTTFIPSFVKRSLLYVGSQTRITSQTSHFFNSYNKKYIRITTGVTYGSLVSIKLHLR